MKLVCQQHQWSTRSWPRHFNALPSPVFECLSQAYMPKGNELLPFDWLICWFPLDNIEQFYIPAQCSSLTIEIKIPTTVKKTKKSNQKTKYNIKLIRSWVHNSAFENVRQKSKSRMTIFESYTMFLCKKIIMRLFSNWVRPAGKKMTLNNRIVELQHRHRIEANSRSLVSE